MIVAGRQTITVVGLRYIGPPTATLAPVKQRYGFDINEKLQMVLSRKVPHSLQWPDMRGLLYDVRKGNPFLSRSGTFRNFTINSDATIETDGKKAELSYVKAVSRTVAKDGSLATQIIDPRSPGTTGNRQDHFFQRACREDFDLAHCPGGHLKVLHELDQRYKC